MMDRCGVCSNALEPWAEMPVDAHKRTLTPYGNAQRCVVCGVGQILPRPSKGEIPSFYEIDTYYTHEGSDQQQLSFIDKALLKAAYLVQKENPFDVRTIVDLLKPKSKVIDLGCGDARMLIALKACGFDVIGVDPDTRAISKAAASGVKVLQGTADDLPSGLEPGTFDLAIMSHSLEHCSSPAAAVKNVRSLLKPDGLFYAEVPNCENIYFRTIFVSSVLYDAPRHLWFFNHRGLTQLLKQADLVPMSWYYNGFCRHYHAQWRRYEAGVHDLAHKAGRVTSRRNGIIRSLWVLAREIFAPRRLKYDSMGVLVRATLP